MKKRLVALLAAAMVLTLGTTALAAPSITIDDVDAAAEAVTSVKTEDGNEVEVTALDVSALTDAYDYAEAENEDAEVEVLGAVNVEFDIPEGKTLTLTFEVAGVKAGDAIVVLHYDVDDQKWETITPDEVKDGVVVATFSSLSPVVIARVTTESAPTGVVSVLPIIAIACVAGIAGCVKKDNE